MATRASRTESVATGSDELQDLFPDDALPEPSFCDLCASITYEALESEDGYAHVGDVADLEHGKRACHLCRLIVVESARHGVAGEQILTLDDAIAEFESRW